jgi:outer membrane lipoprotein carrier protein
MPWSLHFCLLAALLAHGELPQNVRSLESRLQAAYRAGHTLRVIFREEYFEGGKLIRSAAGTAYFRRPGKMRWEYEAPDKDLFLVDGKTAWFYVPADRTVTRAPAKNSSDWRTPLAFLLGDAKLSRVCSKVSLAPVQPETAGLARLQCRFRAGRGESADADSEAKSADSVREDRTTAAEFDVERETGLLRRIVVHDPGVDIQFDFDGWQFNPQVADQLFRFTVPMGVAIVNGELAAGEESVK